MIKRPVILGTAGLSAGLAVLAIGLAQGQALPLPSSSPSASVSPAATAAAGSAGDQRQVFTTTFNVLNPSVQQSTPSGTATVVVDGDRIGVMLSAQGLDPSIPHMAHIHGGNSGNACPTLADDANKDGIVDVLEGLPAYGPILVPFDGDINSQLAGSTFTPVADQSGNLTYSASGSVSSIIKDLNTPPDPVATSGLGHLNGKPFDLSQLHIVVHGINPSTTLPSTVQSITTPTGAPVPANASIPVLCGQLTQVAGPVHAQGGTATSPSPTGSPGTTPSPGASTSPGVSPSPSSSPGSMGGM